MAISAQSQISEGEMDNLAGLTPDGFLGVRENAQIKSALQAMNQKVDEEFLAKFIQYFNIFLDTGI